MLTAAVLRRTWPHAPQSLIDGVVTAAPAVFPKYRLDTPTVIAHAMAQFSHECGGGTIREENLSYSAKRLTQVWPKHFNSLNAARYAHNPQKLANYIYEPPIHNDLGNRPDSDDGWQFRGRGGSQVTGRHGYTKLAEVTGIDILSNPDLVNEPQYWLECAVADFVICGCLPYAQRDDIRGVTRHLNGGYVGLSERTAWLARWKRALAEAHEPAPEDALSKEEIKDLQTRLRDLGYAEVGNPDGVWGSRTTGAVAAFQRHEMLSVSGHYDQATQESLDLAVERPVAPARAAATAADLRDAGSTTIAAADKASLVAKVKGGLGATLVGLGAGDKMGLLDSANDAVGKAEQAKSLWGRVHDLVQPIAQDNNMLVVGAGLIIAALIVAWAAKKVIERRVEDHRSGVHAGPQE